MENHPTPLEVEKLRHRKVKQLTYICTIQGKLEKRRKILLPGSLGLRLCFLIALGTFQIDVYLHYHCSTEYQLFKLDNYFDVTEVTFS